MVLRQAARPHCQLIGLVNKIPGSSLTLDLFFPFLGFSYSAHVLPSLEFLILIRYVLCVLFVSNYLIGMSVC